jgi:hypothetical protein
VFKAFDQVSISSGHYSFKFDKNSQLGMIAPIWERFPEPIVPNHTSFLLRFSPDSDSKEFIRELAFLDGGMLIFLRRLRRIEITVMDNDVTTSQRSIARNDDDGGPFIAIQKDQQAVRYMVMHHNATGLPIEARRPGVLSSEVVLAFPIDDNQKPKLEPQQVYAFLPIRDYGFEVRAFYLSSFKST